MHTKMSVCLFVCLFVCLLPFCHPSHKMPAHPPVTDRIGPSGFQICTYSYVDSCVGSDAVTDLWQSYCILQSHDSHDQSAHCFSDLPQTTSIKNQECGNEVPIFSLCSVSALSAVRTRLL